MPVFDLVDHFVYQGFIVERLDEGGFPFLQFVEVLGIVVPGWLHSLGIP